MSIRKIIEEMDGTSRYEVSIAVSGTVQENVIMNGNTMGEALNRAVSDFRTTNDVLEKDLVVSCQLHNY